MQCKVKIFFVLCSVAFCSGEDFGEPVNVALNKASNQSSIIYLIRTGQEFPAENGVDGNTKTCILTKNEIAPWWEVDLGHLFPILNITIYARPAYFYRLEFCDIFLDGQLCTTIGRLTNNPINLQCNHTMYGQKLKIIRKSPNYLNFCDFQVWVPQFISVCDAGKYGSDCNLNCPQNCNGGPDKSVCHVNTGTCYGCTDGRYGRTCEESCESMKCFGKKCDQDNGQCLYCDGNFKPPACTECRDTYFGSTCSQDCHWYTYCFGSKTCNTTTGYCDSCIAGRKGIYCGQECNDGTYGEDCKRLCGQCKGGKTCNAVTGQCFDGCSSGWEGTLCDQPCQGMTFGVNCSKACGKCREGETCNSVSGVCTKGCNPGWLPPDMCNINCADGRYGQDCTETCGQCENEAVCNKVTGHCPLCKVGLQPFLCKQECQGMTFGVNCSKACGKCRGGVPCNSVSGVCSKGCNPGWLPPDMCNIKCDLGYYGDGCNQTCGYCRFITQCRHDNGFCMAGCAASFQGDLCIDATTSDGLIAGSILGGFVIIAASILIAILVNRSRNKQDTVTLPSAVCLSELQERTEDISTHSPCAVQQLVDYEEIENTHTYDRLNPNSQNEKSTYSPTVFKEIGTCSQTK